MPQTDHGKQTTESSSRPLGDMMGLGPTRREHWQAVLLALVCSVLFLRDGLLTGRALVPHPPELFDVHRAEAQAAGTFDAKEVYRGNIGMTDKYLQSVCWDRVMQDRLQQWEVPRWTRDIGGGAPFVPQMAQPYQPINLLLFLIPSVEWYGYWYLIHLVLFGWLGYLFLRRIGCLHAAALLGLVAAVLGMWTQCKLHHNVILTAALSLWPMLSATHDLVAGRATGSARRWSVGWLALWTGLAWSTGFVVVALQASYLTVAYALFCAFRGDRSNLLMRLAPVGLGLGIGGILSFANMLPILLASSESARSGTFDAARLQTLGLEWDHLLSLAWPDLLSWPADRFYPDPASASGARTSMPWSQLVLLEQPLRPEDNSAFQNWVETSFAVGTIPFAAACTAICSRRHLVPALFFATIALIAFGMATAEQPFFTLATIVPGLSAGDLRRLLFSVSMPMVVMAGLGADAWLRDGFRWPGRIALGTILTVSIIALLWLWQNSDPNDFVYAYAELYAMDTDAAPPGVDTNTIALGAKAQAAIGEIENNQEMLAISAMLALLASASGLLALWRRHRFCAPFLIACTIIELLIAGLGPVQTVESERVTTPPKVLGPVAAEHRDGAPRPRIQRLITSVNNNAGLPGNMPGFLGFADANAYNPLPPARFEEFFNCIEDGVGYGGAGVGSFRQADSLSHPLCDLYGIRFILSDTERKTDATLIDRTPPDTGRFRLLERTTTMPRATFVRQVDIIPDTSDASTKARLETLADRNRNPRDQIILEDPDATLPEPANDAQADVQLVIHDDEYVQIQVNCSHDGYVRLADPYDAGWQVTIDGEPAPLLVADHYLRAVYVKAGDHTIVFSYDGPRVVWPLRISLVALAMVIFCLWTGRRRLS